MISATSYSLLRLYDLLLFLEKNKAAMITMINTNPTIPRMDKGNHIIQVMNHHEMSIRPSILQIDKIRVVKTTP